MCVCVCVCQSWWWSGVPGHYSFLMTWACGPRLTQLHVQNPDTHSAGTEAQFRFALFPVEKNTLDWSRRIRKRQLKHEHTATGHCCVYVTSIWFLGGLRKFKVLLLAVLGAFHCWKWHNGTYCIASSSFLYGMHTHTHTACYYNRYHRQHKRYTYVVVNNAFREIVLFMHSLHEIAHRQ